MRAAILGEAPPSPQKGLDYTRTALGVQILPGRDINDLHIIPYLLKTIVSRRFCEFIAFKCRLSITLIVCISWGRMLKAIASIVIRRTQNIVRGLPVKWS